jgi:hypothetical protein
VIIFFLPQVTTKIADMERPSDMANTFDTKEYCTLN